MMRLRSSGRVAAAGLALWCLTPAAVQANVYPAGVNVDASSLNLEDCTGTAKITYFLNEDADGTGTLPGVKIEILDGSSTAVRTVTFAAQKKGKRTWEWDGRNDLGARVANGSYSVRITAADFGYSVWTQISDDANTQVQFERAVGVAVNRNIDPVTRVASPLYGRTYVANPRTLATVSGRAMGDGIYVLNPDRSDALNQGDTALTGGIDWSTSATTSPWRLRVGPDNNLYISDWSDAPAGSADLKGAGLYRVDPDVSAGSGISVFNNAGRAANGLNAIHGSIASTAAIVGTLATGDLMVYALDEDMPPSNQGMWFWNIGGGPLPWNTAPTRLNGLLLGVGAPGVAVDLDRGPDGKFYLLQNRSNGNETGLYVTDTDGATVLFDSLAATRTLLGNPSAVDLLRISRTVAVAPDGSACYVLNDTGNIRVLPLVNGIPQLGQMVTINAFNIAGTAQGATVVDAAGNVYITSNLAERLRVYSPPSGPNSSATATTAFTLSKPGTGGPSIQTQPQNASFCVNGSVAFNVLASGSGLTYQWKKNGLNLSDGPDVSGSTTPSLSLSNVPASDNASVVSVLVCNANGVILSNPAALNIGVRILQAPDSQSVCTGSNATFMVSAAGKGTLSYQWQKDVAGDNNFTDIGGATSTSVTLNAVTVADNGTQIRAVVTDECGPVNSAAATLTVSGGPNVSNLSGPKTVNAGQSATYSVAASGTGAIHYQWKKVLNSVATNVGTDTPFLSLPTVCSDNGASITVDATDDCGTVTATVGGLTVNNPTPTPEVCGNGLDDDCNGATDCDDATCAASCCNTPFADAEGNGNVGLGQGDGDVDMDDFAVLQACYTGDGVTPVPDLPYCKCLDRDNDGLGDDDVDLADFLKFTDCATGASIPWVATSACP